MARELTAKLSSEDELELTRKRTLQSITECAKALMREIVQPFRGPGERLWEKLSDEGREWKKDKPMR